MTDHAGIDSGAPVCKPWWYLESDDDLSPVDWDESSPFNEGFDHRPVIRAIRKKMREVLEPAGIYLCLFAVYAGVPLCDAMVMKGGTWDNDYVAVVNEELVAFLEEYDWYLRVYKVGRLRDGGDTALIERLRALPNLWKGEPLCGIMPEIAKVGTPVTEGQK